MSSSNNSNASNSARLFSPSGRMSFKGGHSFWYFAYGSNMSERRMSSERGVQYSTRVRGKVSGLRLVFNKVTRANPMVGAANLIPDSTSEVEGVLYECLPEAITVLDGYEGYPNDYLREKLLVTMDDDRTVEALVYIANPALTSPGLRPTRQYIGYLLEGKDLLSAEYRATIEGFETAD